MGRQLVGEADWGVALRAARTANGVSLRGLQSLVAYDFTYLGQVERGEKPGSLELATRCDTALEAGGALLAAFPGRAGDAVPAATGPTTGTAPAAGARAASGRVLKAPSAPPTGARRPAARRRPAGAPVEDCTGACAAAAADRLCIAGPDGCRLLPVPGGLGRLLAENRHELTRLRSAQDRTRLLGVRADLALVAGRTALLDQRDPVRARGYLTLARETAGELGSDARAAAATAHLAVVAASEDRPAVAAGYLETARRHADRTGLPLLGVWLDRLDPSRASGLATRPAQGLSEVGTALERPCTARPPAPAEGACPGRARPTGRG
jgi:hypothetical protein